MLIMKDLKIEKVKSDFIDEQKLKNETITTELNFELLKQYAWLSSAGVGAIILLVQLKAVEVGGDVYISLGLLMLSIFFSISGQDYIVDSLLKGNNIYMISKTLKLFRGSSLLLLGIGIGFMVMQLI
jgi:hypothetical protein